MLKFIVHFRAKKSAMQCMNCFDKNWIEFKIETSWSWS